MARIITGTGSYLPDRVVDNHELEQFVQNFDAGQAGGDLDSWIRRHYGIHERHWAAEDESTGAMATAAARRALQDAGLQPADLDLIVLATATSDHVAPHAVSRVQSELGCKAVFHQLQDACPGFLNSLIVADSLMENLGYRRALVIAAEKMTHLVDKRDFRMIGLFADGAGAVVLEDLPVAKHYGFQAFYAGSDGAAGYSLRVPAGGTARPLTAERLAAGEQYLVSEFHKVYPFAVDQMTRCVLEVLQKAGHSSDDVRWLIPHHASAKIIEDSGSRTKIPRERVLMAIDHIGNISSASVPTALDESRRKGRLAEDDLVVMVALGGGMAWASTLYRWAGPEVIQKARQLTSNGKTPPSAGP